MDKKQPLLVLRMSISNIILHRNLSKENSNQLQSTLEEKMSKWNSDQKDNKIQIGNETTKLYKGG